MQSQMCTKITNIVTIRIENSYYSYFMRSV